MKNWKILLVAMMVLPFMFWGCQNFKNDIIKIGVIISETGSAAEYGKWTKNGLELALAEINKHSKKKIRLIYEDDATDARRAIAAFNKLVDIDNVNIMIGPLTSSSVLSVAPLTERKEVFLLSPCASNPQITQAGKFTFRNWISDEFEGRCIANYFKDKKRIAVLSMNNEYGIGVGSVFMEEAIKNGCDIVFNGSYNENQTDFRPVIMQLLRVRPEIIFVPGHAKEAATFIKQSKELGLDTQFASSVAFGSLEVFNIGGSAIDGTIFSSPYFDVESDIVKVFKNAYHGKYNAIPEVFAAHAYDALKIISEAIKNNENLSSNTLRDYLLTHTFDGITGKTVFDNNGDVIKPVAINIANNNNFKKLYIYEP